MMRMRTGISRTAAAIALLAAFGCDADSAKRPGNSTANPVGPLASQLVSVTSSRTSLTVGNTTQFSVITVQALAPDFVPLANGTQVSLTSNLGAFDAPSGGRTATLALSGGKATTNLYAGNDDGTARVTATVNGFSASVSLTIFPEPPEPEPAPTEAVLQLIVSPSFVDEDVAQAGGADSEFDVTAKVTGSDGNPFPGAGVYFVSDNSLGTFESSSLVISDTFSTNGAGEAGDTLAITDAHLLAFPGSSFKITAHLGVEGGEKTASVTINITEGQAPAEADSIQLVSNTSFVLDDGGVDDEEIDLTGTVFDQFLSVFAGGQVVFSSNFPSGTFSDNPDTSDLSGEVTTTFSVNSADITAFPSNSFTITATLSTPGGPATDTVTITIVRPPVANFTFEDDAVEPNEVDFTDTSLGNPTTWAWDFQNDTIIDSTLQNPDWDFDADSGPGTYQVRLTVSNAVGSSTVVKEIDVPVTPP